jgi:superfamily I DNA/RNA helicase/RecB family exonuclease
MPEGIDALRTTVDAVEPPGRGLDAVQREIVAIADTADAVVLGAGGSGKSTLAVELVADRLLDRGWAADSVLVLAATRTSAAGMRDRLARRVGIPTPGPLARTIASLAFEIVRADAAARALPAPTLLTGADQDRVVADLLEGEIVDEVDDYWPAGIDRDVRALGGFRAELRELQARLLERGATPADLAGLGDEHDRPAWVASARFLASLEAVQDAAAPGAVDSTELVIEAAVAVERGAPITGRLRMLVVDDAQELGLAGLRFVEALARAGVRIILLGDPDLATGGFRGAVPGGFTRVLEAAGRSPIRSTLPIVHRQREAVRAAVSSAAQRIGTAGAGVQRASGAALAGGSASAVRLRGRAAEVAFVARRLRERRVRAGVPWSSMAIVVRSGGAVTGLVRELRALEVPASAAGVLESPRDDAGVRALVLALELVVGRRDRDQDSVGELLAGPLGRLDAVAIRRLRAGLRQEELAAGGDRGAGELLVSAFDLAGEPETHADGEAVIGFDSIDTAAGRRARQLAQSLHRARASLADGATIEDLIWGLWDRSGLATVWGEQAEGTGLLADEANRHLDAVVAFFAAAKRYAERQPDALPGTFLDGWRSTSVQEDSLAARGRADAVLVGTPSALIGREFDTVVVAGVQDGTWPNLRVRGSLLQVPDLVDLLDGRVSAIADRRRDVLHDELRLFAGSLARASDTVLVTAVDADDEAPSPFMRLLPDVDPGPEPGAPLTLRGLVGRLRRELVRTGSPAAASALARLAAEGITGAAPAEWSGLPPSSTDEPLIDLDDPEAMVRVSPSRIEAFESCPLHWAIEQLGGGRPSTGASLGTLVHAIAQDADTESADVLLQRVRERWGELDFETTWASEQAQTKAAEVTRRLAAYLRDVRAASGTTIGTELPFELTIGRASLRGMIDRVERYDDGSVLVVDLKTGRETGYSTAESVADHAQLAAYQLAVEAGAVEGVEAGARSRGAALVILSRGTRDRDYVEPVQAPFDDAGFAAFRERVEAAAAGMAGPVFLASIGSHCLDPFSHGACRLHVVRAVTS